MNKEKNLEEIASQRMTLIIPLLDEEVDEQSLIELKKRIANDSNLSYRTITRYYNAYLSEGFSGLKPKVGYRMPKSSLPSNFEELLEHAIILRRELPTRSVMDIIRILELEEMVKPGCLPRSTLQRHLQAAGFGAKQIKIYTKTGVASKRFQKSHRMMLLQGDIKYGPYLPIGKNGAPKQVYLSAFIDDATRYIVSAKFYDNQKTEIIEDTLRIAIMGYGKPKRIFVDNGKQYRSDWLKKACNKLGIRLSFAKPYCPSAKGKIEYFNKRIDGFLAEVALNKPKTLEELNEALDLWINQYYHNNPHSGLDGLTPQVAFRGDKKGLNFVDSNLLREAFLHSEIRNVDKTGCISLLGNTYEVGPKFIGRKVEVYYDPIWLDEVEVHHPDFKPFMAPILVIGENCGINSKLPDALTPLNANGSRLLKALKEHQHEQTSNIAISFKDLGVRE